MSAFFVCRRAYTHSHGQQGVRAPCACFCILFAYRNFDRHVNWFIISRCVLLFRLVFFLVELSSFGGFMQHDYIKWQKHAYLGSSVAQFWHTHISSILPSLGFSYLVLHTYAFDVYMRCSRHFFTLFIIIIIKFGNLEHGIISKKVRDMHTHIYKLDK